MVLTVNLLTSNKTGRVLWERIPDYLFPVDYLFIFLLKFHKNVVQDEHVQYGKVGLINSPMK